jgi:hypothetical protein
MPLTAAMQQDRTSGSRQTDQYRTALKLYYRVINSLEVRGFELEQLPSNTDSMANPFNQDPKAPRPAWMAPAPVFEQIPNLGNKRLIVEADSEIQIRPLPKSN